jgi:hypothetical protein
MSQNGHHISQREQDRRRKRRTILIVAVLGLVAFGGGFLAANTFGGNDEATVGPTTSPSASASVASPSPSGSPSSSPSPKPSANPGILDDGQHFVQVRQAGGGEDGPFVVRFDLAYFYTGADAFEYAAEHDVEMTNDYIIANDNPKLRWMPLADDAAVRYVPEGTCCKLHEGDINAFLTAVEGSAMTDYPDMAATWWWITVKDGQITGFVQQWLP